MLLCKTCDYKLSHDSNLKRWGMKYIPVHYPVPARYLIWYPAKSDSGWIPKNAIWCIPSHKQSCTLEKW